MNRCARLGLGTVQWGMAYGIANRGGQATDAAVVEMLRHARERGVILLDTAHAYGDAERVLGEQEVVSQGFQVVTKTRPVQSQDITKADIAAISVAFSESLERLRCKSVYGLLAHRSDNLLMRGGDRLWDALQAFKAQGRVGKIGVSVYHPQQLGAILDRYPIDLVQLPFNLYDQRFAQTGLLQRLKQAGIEVHARSAFLQGLLLLPANELPAHFASIREHQARLHRQFADSGLTPLEGCLLYCLHEVGLDRVIVGCETSGQLAEILRVAESAVDDPPGLPNIYALNDNGILMPSNWNA